MVEVELITWKDNNYMHYAKMNICSDRYLSLLLVGLLCVACSANGLILPVNRMQPTRSSSSRQTMGLPPSQRLHAQRNPIMELRGGQLSLSGSKYLKRLSSKGVIKQLAFLLHSFVDPVISGGLLSGGLHAITGKSYLFAIP